MSLTSNKLSKYVNKYKLLTNQFAGIIGDIPLKKIDQVIKYENLPEEIQKNINLITIPKTHLIPVGSGTLKIQRYPSDVDIMNIIEKPISTENMLTFFINNIKQIVTNIKNDNSARFSDFKAGGLHWTADEILNEVKGNLTLRDACKILDVIKIDIFVPYNKRYIEMSTFFILKSSTGFINVDKDYFDNFDKSLFDDIQKYRTVKPFKAVKRFWSLLKIRNDLETMDKLEHLINSNVSLFSQINADIETLELILEKNVDYDKNFVIDEIDNFKDKINHILDIEFDDKFVYNNINNLKLSFENDNSKEEILTELRNLHDYILTIINRETNNYLKNINFSLPDKFVKSTTNPNTIFNHDTLVNMKCNLSESNEDISKEPESKEPESKEPESKEPESKEKDVKTCSKNSSQDSILEPYSHTIIASMILLVSIILI